jgi:hypothetical protein
VPGDWKPRALLGHLDGLGDASYVWADAVDTTLVSRATFAWRRVVDRRPLDTDPSVGLAFLTLKRSGPSLRCERQLSLTRRVRISP